MKITYNQNGRQHYTALLNEKGFEHIKTWIKQNKDRNLIIKDLILDGVAEEVNQAVDCVEDLENNGEYRFEIGLRDAQGHVMTIDFKPEHFDFAGWKTAPKQGIYDKMTIGVGDTVKTASGMIASVAEDHGSYVLVVSEEEPSYFDKYRRYDKADLELQ
jgi:hypothetical protein